jgi:uncharacterized protein (DUF4415 family)
MPAHFLNIEMLPAQYGDCLWVEYGKDGATHRLLIDGGPVGTFEFIEKRIAMMTPGERAFELIVLSHVDADHIEGLVRLFAERPLPFAVDTVWFNGWRQMNKTHGMLGALQGEFLSALLARRVPNSWDTDGPPQMIPKTGSLPTTTLPGGMKLTLVSPTVESLKKMAGQWKTTIAKAGIQPGDLDAAWTKLATRNKFLPKKGLLGTTPNLDALIKKQFPTDQAKPNGSSIAFLAEYEGKSALFLADAHPTIVAASVSRLCQERGVTRLPVDVVKISHHGSKGNTSAALLKLLDCKRILISTSGARFQHPHAPCMAQIIKWCEPTEIYFNYRSKQTKPWIAPAAEKKFKYKAVVRLDADVSLKVTV